MIDSYSNTFHSQKIHQTLSNTTSVCAVRGMKHVVTALCPVCSLGESAGDWCDCCAAAGLTTEQLIIISDKDIKVTAAMSDKCVSIKTLL